MPWPRPSSRLPAKQTASSIPLYLSNPNAVVIPRKEAVIRPWEPSWKCDFPQAVGTMTQEEARIRPRTIKRRVVSDRQTPGPAYISMRATSADFPSTLLIVCFSSPVSEDLMTYASAGQDRKSSL